MRFVEWWWKTDRCPERWWCRDILPGKAVTRGSASFSAVPALRLTIVQVSSNDRDSFFHARWTRRDIWSAASLWTTRSTRIWSSDVRKSSKKRDWVLGLNVQFDLRENDKQFISSGLTIQYFEWWERCGHLWQHLAKLAKLGAHSLDLTSPVEKSQARKISLGLSCVASGEVWFKKSRTVSITLFNMSKPVFGRVRLPPHRGSELTFV